MTDNPITILIVDDHPLFRNGLRTLIETYQNWEVIGEASTGEEALPLAEALNPDVILMDIQLPNMSGVEAIGALMKLNPKARILVLSMFEENHVIFSAIRAGARGYVVKNAGPDQIIRAIEAAACGEAIFSPAIADRIISLFGQIKPATQVKGFESLTDREIEILKLIGKGLGNGEIASQLALTTKTVSNYVTIILSKLEVSDRVQAAIRAREAGLTDY